MMHDIQHKLAELEQRLVEKAPDIKTLLQQIHNQLKSDPDVVTILSDAECGILVSGLKKQTQTEITVTALKSKKTAMKNMQVGVDL